MTTTFRGSLCCVVHSVPFCTGALAQCIALRCSVSRCVYKQTNTEIGRGLAGQRDSKARLHRSHRAWRRDSIARRHSSLLAKLPTAPSFPQRSPLTFLGLFRRLGSSGIPNLENASSAKQGSNSNISTNLTDTGEQEEYSECDKIARRLIIRNLYYYKVDTDKLP